MGSSDDSSGIEITVGEPKYFGIKEAIIIQVIGFVPILITSFLFGIGIVSIINGSFYLIKYRSATYFCIGICTLSVCALMLYFLPVLINLNVYVQNIVKLIRFSHDIDQNGYVVQITCDPRYFKGVHNGIENPDDIGILHFEDAKFTFKGDHIHLSLPYTEIRSIETLPVGFRGLWISGKRIKVSVSTFYKYRSYEFYERSSWTVPVSQKISAEILTRLKEKAFQISPSAG